MTEQQGKSEGGKEPPSRSINQIFELFQSSKICLSGAKRLFRHAEKSFRFPGRTSFALSGISLLPLCVFAVWPVLVYFPRKLCYTVQERGRQEKDRI